ncbi:MAG: RBBP9/YdeN family alpha/beta hydrolase [Sphingomonadaceae bacterium]
MSYTVLFVPGLRDHVEDHWQTHAAKALPGSRTVAPLEVDRLSRKARVEALDNAIHAIDGEVVLAAHSAGCLMVAHWVENPLRADTTGKVRGALLATPADVENPLPEGYPTLDSLRENGWLPIARSPFPFPTLVVASRNDPLAGYTKVEELARCWEAELLDAGEVGHLNPPSGYGPWPEALALRGQMAGKTD